jgi:hypothetical protein
LEDVTLTLTGGANNLKLVGVDFINNAAQTAKLRTAVVNVNSGTYTNCIAYGVQSGATGTNVLSFSSSNAIRASTINVTMGNTGGTGCGIIVNGPNHFTCRDTNIFSTGPTGYVNGNTGSHFIGAIVNTPNGSTGNLELRTSTLNASTFDVARPNGRLTLGFTDLLNSSTDGNSFNVTTKASSTAYALTGNFTSGTLYLIPGTVNVTDAPTYAYSIPFDQNTIVINSVIQYTGPQLTTQTITVNIHKNTTTSPAVYAITFNSASPNSLISGSTYKYKEVAYNKSSTFLYPNDTLIMEVTITGNINKGILSVQLGEY